MASDESYKDPTNLQAKIQKHQAFEAEVAAHSNAIVVLDNTGMEMINQVFLMFFYILHKNIFRFRGKSLLESWDTTFLPDWQPTLIFVQFISNFLCMCSNSMASAHVILK